MNRIIMFVLLIGLVSCDRVETHDGSLNKDGSVEILFEIEHRDSFDILRTEKNVWYKGERHKNVMHVDTIPRLDSIEVEDEDGNRMKIRDSHEIYVTIK